MMPLKPSPNIAATANSPASSWVSRKPAIAVIWHTEPASTVRSPPMRSVTSPQNCRLRKAQPSSNDSIPAPGEGCPGGARRTGAPARAVKPAQKEKKRGGFDPGFAERPQEHAGPDIERSRRAAEARQREPDRDHQRAADDH